MRALAVRRPPRDVSIAGRLDPRQGPIEREPGIRQRHAGDLELGRLAPVGLRSSVFRPRTSRWRLRSGCAADRARHSDDAETQPGAAVHGFHSPRLIRVHVGHSARIELMVFGMQYSEFQTLDSNSGSGARFLVAGVTRCRASYDGETGLMN